MTDRYESPLSSRYASIFMQKLFSSDNRYSTWRKLWLSLAKAEKEMPFIATENILMEAVKKGGDRQKLHEQIRKASMRATQRMKDGEDGKLLEELLKIKELGLSENELSLVLEPKKYIGRSIHQTEVLVIKAKLLTKDIKTEEDSKVEL